MQMTLFDLLPGPLEGDARKACLLHICPEKNCFRFYNLSLEENLFGDIALVIHWGRLGTSGRIRIASSGSRDETRKYARCLARSKVRRGYIPQEENPKPSVFRGSSWGHRAQ
jgi:predicted DNA-binding WGR domain protein